MSSVHCGAAQNPDQEVSHTLVPASVHTQQGTHLLSAKQRRDTFYKYEKRIRELSTQEKARRCLSPLSGPLLLFNDLPEPSAAPTRLVSDPGIRQENAGDNWSDWRTAAEG